MTARVPPLELNHDDLWKAHAACLDSDPGQWFPESGTATEARTVCAGCPVRDDCLQHALTHGETFGVWGGASERVRRRMRSLLRRCPHPGRAWRQRGCRCPFCTLLVEHDGRMRALLEGKPTGAFDSRGPGVRHGTPSCYPKGCRRPECLAALREWRAERRRLLREQQEEDRAS